MKKLFIWLLIFVISLNAGLAQTGQLMVKTSNKGLYLDHSVAAKEGLFSIGRVYNVHPKFIAAYNNLDMSKGLSIGQVIHIPLTDTNFTQKNNKGVPVYYRVGEKEGLLKVGNANNKVTIQSLRDWNKLTNDNLSAGTKLIVGFLVTIEMPAVAVSKPVNEEPKQITEETQTVKTQPKEEKVTIKTEPAAEKPMIKDEPKKTEPVSIKQQVTSSMTGQGYFKLSFDQQVKKSPVAKTETVTSGIFKTTSGWQDAKFYLLMDGIQSGTIVRIINPDNNKTVYAKVLGEMNGIRQNQGLNIRISNAAASTLGIEETETDKFIVKINY